MCSRVLGSFSAFALIFASCDEADKRVEVPPTQLDLLVRAPDSVIEEPGELRPLADAEWGALGGPGWREASPTLALPDGTLYVETNQPGASLRLPATDAQERVLSITLWRARSAPGTSGRLRVRLNGIEIDQRELPDTPTTIAIPTRALLWKRGDNALEFETPKVEKPGPERWDTLAVSSVRYGSPRLTSFDRGAKRYTLPSGTGLRYSIEVSAGARLFVRGTSEGAGELMLSLARLDPQSGDLAPVGSATRIRVEGLLERSIALPDPSGALLALEIAWHSPDPTSFRLEKLHVDEARALPRPPIVFVSIDTFSARHLSLYGYRRRTTPELEEFARDAVVFERCVANAPWTMPSYLSVMTGLYPGAHLAEVASSPLVQLDNYDYWQVADSRWTLAEALRGRGYQTAAAVDTHWLSPRFRIDQGFDLYDMEPALQPFTNPYYGIAFILDRLASWLDGTRDPSAPFFAFLHTLDAHGPYWPEPPYRGTFATDLSEDPRPTAAGSAPMTYGAIPVWMARTSVPDETQPIPSALGLEEIVARYDEALLKTDAYLGRLFDLLRERGTYDEAVILISGDHGESFDHGLYSHGCLWEDIVHVPLVLKLPHGKHAGTRVATSVQLVDVYPTLLELAGADGGRDWLHGRSLLRLLESDEHPPRPTFSQGGHIEQAMVEQAGWKLVELEPGVRPGEPQLLTHPRTPREWLEANFPELLTRVPNDELFQELRARGDFYRKFGELQQLVRGPYYELYDLNTDPLELHDLAAERPEVVERLRKLLGEEKARTRAAQKDAHPEIRPQGFSPDELEALEDLGYLGQ